MTYPAADSDLTSELAAYAASIRLANVPDIVRHQATLCILDTIGCVVAGGQVEDWKPLFAVESADHDKPQAAVIGLGRRLSVEAAARTNAYMGDVFELNDLIGGHASIGNVTALLALAESIGATGAQLLESVIVGLEVTARVYYGYYPAMKPFDEVGMNPVIFPSSYGIAAGAARLLQLSQTQIGHAMGIGGSLAGWCPAEVVFGEGGTVKPMLFGSCPATSGIAGAKYARAGMTGPRRLLEGPRGYFVTAARSMYPEAVRDRDTWHVATPRRKYHACCGYIHSPIDVVASMRREGVRFDEAGEIRVGVTALTLPAVSKDRPPASGNEARFHLEYCVALAAIGEDTILPEHSTDFASEVQTPKVRAAMAKVKVFADPDQTHYHQCMVSVHDAQGRELASKAGRSPKGSPQNPMTDEEVIAKFTRLVRHRLAGAALDEYIGRALNLSQHDRWDWLVGSFDKTS